MSDKYSEFEDALFPFLVQHQCWAKSWRGAGGHAQVLEIESPIDLLIYVRTDRSDDWWGITYNVLEKLIASQRKWSMILLTGEGQEGYLLPHALVTRLTPQMGRGETQFHVHEKDASSGMHFKSYQDLFQSLLPSAVKT